MDIKLLITSIYNNTINVLLEGISDENKKELIYGYKEYLVRVYRNYYNSKYPVTELIKLFSNLEISKWKNATPDERMIYFLKDQALDEVRRISYDGYKYALKRISTVHPGGNQTESPITLDVMTANKSIEMLKEYLPKIRSFNKNIAIQYVSEGSIDFLYASGQTDCLSFRTSHNI